jgi:hypothetical protein
LLGPLSFSYFTVYIDSGLLQASLKSTSFKLIWKTESFNAYLHCLIFKKGSFHQIYSYTHLELSNSPIPLKKTDGTANAPDRGICAPFPVFGHHPNKLSSGYGFNINMKVKQNQCETNKTKNTVYSVITIVLLI